MRCSIISFFLLGALTFFAAACKNCGPSAEPSLYLTLSDSMPTRIDTLYALHTKRPLPTQPYSTTALMTYSQLTLPLDLNADSSSYVVQLKQRRDTIIVFYKRNYSYRDTKCGYVLDLTSPAGKKAQTTGGRVLSIDYQQNSYSSYFLHSERLTAIFLTVQL